MLENCVNIDCTGDVFEKFETFLSKNSKFSNVEIRNDDTEETDIPEQ